MELLLFSAVAGSNFELKHCEFLLKKCDRAALKIVVEIVRQSAELDRILAAAVQEVRRDLNVAMARGLNLQVVAEGIETFQQWQCLHEMRLRPGPRLLPQPPPQCRPAGSRPICRTGEKVASASRATRSSLRIISPRGQPIEVASSLNRHGSQRAMISSILDPVCGPTPITPAALACRQPFRDRC